jgi:cytochrome bd-type quinol oxidase subunit 2
MSHQCLASRVFWFRVLAQPSSLGVQETVFFPTVLLQNCHIYSSTISREMLEFLFYKMGIPLH